MVPDKTEHVAASDRAEEARYECHDLESPEARKSDVDQPEIFELLGRRGSFALGRLGTASGSGRRGVVREVVWLLQLRLLVLSDLLGGKVPLPGNGECSSSLKLGERTSTYHGAVVDQWRKTVARNSRVRSLKKSAPFLKRSPATGGMTANMIGNHDFHVRWVLSILGPGSTISS